MTAARKLGATLNLDLDNRVQAFRVGYKHGHAAGAECPIWDTFDVETIALPRKPGQNLDSVRLGYELGYRRGFLDGAYPEPIEVSNYLDVTALRHTCMCSEGTYRWHGRVLFVSAIDGIVQAPIEVRSGPPITPDDEERLTKFFNEQFSARA